MSLSKSNLLERLGGVNAIRAVLDVFYDRILADDRLAPFFEGIKMSSLKLHQLKFFRMALSGDIPANLDVTEMLIQKHLSLFENKGLNATHFDMVAGHLVAALEQCGVPPELVQETVAVVAPLREVFEKGPTVYAAEKEALQARKEQKKRRRFSTFFGRFRRGSAVIN